MEEHVSARLIKMLLETSVVRIQSNIEAMVGLILFSHLFSDGK
jgi:hypothetical protein